jgi:hypothetical protein
MKRILKTTTFILSLLAFQVSYAMLTSRGSGAAAAGAEDEDASCLQKQKANTAASKGVELDVFSMMSPTDTTDEPEQPSSKPEFKIVGGIQKLSQEHIDINERNQLLFSTTMISYGINESASETGTGFLWGTYKQQKKGKLKLQNVYLITNKHVAKTPYLEHGELINADSKRETFYIRFHVSDTSTPQVSPAQSDYTQFKDLIKVKKHKPISSQRKNYLTEGDVGKSCGFIEIEVSNPKWIGHSDQSVDLCASNITGLITTVNQQLIAKNNQLVFRLLNSRRWRGGSIYIDPCDGLSKILNSSEIGPGDEIFMIGYPKGIFDKSNNLPLYRRGTISSDLMVNFNDRSEFLIDMECTRGSSGSPIILRKETLKGTVEDAEVEVDATGSIDSDDDISINVKDAYLKRDDVEIEKSFDNYLLGVLFVQETRSLPVKLSISGLSSLKFGEMTEDAFMKNFAKLKPRVEVPIYLGRVIKVNEFEKLMDEVKIQEENDLDSPHKIERSIHDQLIKHQYVPADIENVLQVFLMETQSLPLASPLISQFSIPDSFEALKFYELNNRYITPPVTRNIGNEPEDAIDMVVRMLNEFFSQKAEKTIKEIIIPFNPGGHWVVLQIILTPSGLSVNYIDSLKTKDPDIEEAKHGFIQNQVAPLLTYLHKKYCMQPDFKIMNPRTQTDATACGAIMTQNIIDLFLGNEIKTEDLDTEATWSLRDSQRQRLIQSGMDLDFDSNSDQ